MVTKDENGKDMYGNERRVWQRRQVWQRNLSMVTKEGYGNERREWSILGLLLVLVCRSVPQDPPGRLSILLSRRSFYTLRRPRSANQLSRMCTWHLADQSAIASCIDTTVQRATSD